MFCELLLAVVTESERIANHGAEFHLQKGRFDIDRQAEKFEQEIVTDVQPAFWNLIFAAPTINNEFCET